MPKNRYSMAGGSKQIVFAKALEDGKSGVVFDIGEGRLFAAVVRMKVLEVSVSQMVIDSHLSMECEFLLGEIVETANEDTIREMLARHQKRLESRNG